MERRQGSAGSRCRGGPECLTPKASSVHHTLTFHFFETARPASHTEGAQQLSGVSRQAAVGDRRRRRAVAGGDSWSPASRAGCLAAHG